MDINMEKIKDNIDKAAEFTVKKTEEVVSYAKLNLKKTELKRKISASYKEIGEAIYLNSKDGEDISEKIGFLIKKIDDFNIEIAECNEALDNLKEE